MSKTFVEVAENVGVDERSVRNVFKDHVAFKEREYQFETWGRVTYKILFHHKIRIPNILFGKPDKIQEAPFFSLPID